LDKIKGNIDNYGKIPIEYKDGISNLFVYNNYVNNANDDNNKITKNIKIIDNLEIINNLKENYNEKVPIEIIDAYRYLIKYDDFKNDVNITNAYKSIKILYEKKENITPSVYNESTGSNIKNYLNKYQGENIDLYAKYDKDQNDIKKNAYIYIKQNYKPSKTNNGVLWDMLVQ